MNSGGPEEARVPLTINVSDSLVNATVIHQNISQQLVFTTEDKLWRCLTQHASTLKARNAWIAPVGMLITLIAVFVGADFRDFLLPKDTWRAMFLLGTVGCGIWTLVAVNRSRAPMTIEALIEAIKRDVHL